MLPRSARRAEDPRTIARPAALAGPACCRFIRNVGDGISWALVAGRLYRNAAIVSKSAVFARSRDAWHSGEATSRAVHACLTISANKGSKTAKALHALARRVERVRRCTGNAVCAYARACHRCGVARALRAFGIRQLTCIIGVPPCSAHTNALCRGRDANRGGVPSSWALHTLRI